MAVKAQRTTVSKVISVDPTTGNNMKRESRIERLFGPLAFCCAIAVYLAMAFDPEAIESPPAVSTVVRVAR
jgi:hypothetical protein